MNELGVNNSKLKSKLYNMVGATARKSLRKYFNRTPEQVRTDAGEGGMTIDEYYSYLQNLMRAEKKQARIKRQNEKQKIKRLMAKFINKEIDTFTIRLDRLGDDGLRILRDELDASGGQFLIKAMEGDEVKHIYTYNDRMAGVWKEVLKGAQFTEITQGTGSDEQVVDIIRNFDTLIVERMQEKEDFGGNVLNQGAYFKHYHKLPGVDLSRLSIYTDKEEVKNNGNYVDNCFLTALRYGGASEEVLQIVRTKTKNRYIKNSDFNPICREANIYVEVKTRNTSGKLKSYPHGDKELKGVEGKSFMLGLIDQHYFLNEDLEEPISYYCLKNWNKMKENLPHNYGRTSRNSKARDRELCKNSYKLVEKLLDDRDNFLETIPRKDLLDTQYYDQNKSIQTLTFGDENYEDMATKLERVIANYELTQNMNTINIFCDFETNTKAREAKHTIDSNGNITSYNTKNKKNQPRIRHKAYLGCAMATWFCKKKQRLEIEDVRTFYDKGVSYKKVNGKTHLNDNTPGRQMVKWIANTYYYFDRVNIIAHNAGYDLRVGLFPYVYNYQGIENGNSFILGSGDIYPTAPSARKYLKELKKPQNSIPVKIKCSYKMTNIGLGKFGKVFNLPQEKEYMPYDLYTTKNINLRYIDFKECIAVVPENKKEIFMKNLSRWSLYDSKTDKVDIIGYSREYCILDVKVMQQGYEIFRQHIKEISQKVLDPEIKEECPDLVVDIYNHYTISSVANEMMLIGGCYEDTYQFAGVVREFMQKCVVGGRVMTRRNEKIIKKYEKRKIKFEKKAGKTFEKYSHRYIHDVDATSLYPSSLYRIPGFIRGVPKILPVITTKNRVDAVNALNNLTKDSHYFLEINIKRVGINRDFPLLSYADGLTRKWTNDVVGSEEKPIPMYCDRTMLEDWIEFHDIDFEVVRGYYFDEGYNPKINETMKFLFEERVKQKRLHNPIQNSIKLLMNSGYGKTLEKAHEDSILYKTEKEINGYLKRKYNFVKDVIPTIDGRYKCIEWASIDTHYNQVHQGVSVLSMSKRIMSEVMCLAEDNDYGVYYTDTDSIHIDSEDTKILAKLWDEKYGGKPDRTYHRLTDFIRPKKMIGCGDDSYMGQFHNDFDLPGVSKDKEHLTRSVLFIGLGKKCYMDLLEGFDKDDNIIYGYHIRMKGVSNDALLWGARGYDENMREGVRKLYEHLYAGHSETFDLCMLPDGREKLCFKFFNDFTIGNMNSESTTKDGDEVFGFTRTIQFK